LTAGHCAAGEAVNSLQFTLDSAPVTDTNASYATAVQVRYHPSFNPGSENDPGVDVALIQLGDTNYGPSLNSFLPFGDDFALNASQAALSIGYGDNRDGTTGRERFKPVMFSGLLDLSTPQGSVHDGLVQVVRGSTGEIGCAGDSGSPLTWRTAAGTQIVGVYSTGEDTPGLTDQQECVSGTSAGDYVAVDIFRSFVETTRQQYEGAAPTTCN
jgi:secreted trypsin-like serine protease